MKTKRLLVKAPGLYRMRNGDTIRIGYVTDVCASGLQDPEATWEHNGKSHLHRSLDIVDVLRCFTCRKPSNDDECEACSIERQLAGDV